MVLLCHAYNGSHLLYQFLGITLSTSTWLRPEIHKIVGVIISGTHDFVFGVMEEWHEFIEESRAALSRELVV